MIKKKEFCHVMSIAPWWAIFYGFLCGLPFFALFVWPWFYQTIIDHKSPDKLDLVCGLIAFIVTFPPFLISLLMFRASRLILAEECLIRVTLFRTVVIPFSEIQKVESLSNELKIVFLKENRRKSLSIIIGQFRKRDVGILINYLNDKMGRDTVQKGIVDPTGYFTKDNPK